MSTPAEACVLKCPFCDSQTSSIVKHVVHCKLHSSILRGKVICGVDNCQQIFNSEETLRTHLRRSHLVQVKPSGTSFKTHSQTGANFSCSVDGCNDSFHNYLSLNKHLEEHVSLGCSLRCPVSSCTNSYLKLTSLRSHISRKHPDHHVLNNDSLSEIGLPRSSTDDCDLPESATECNMSDDHLGCANTESAVPSNIGDNPYLCSLSLQSRNMGLLLLKLETDFFIPASTLQFLVEQLKTMEGDSHDRQADQIAKHLSMSNVSTETIAQVLSILSSGKVMEKSFDSDYRRKQFYKSNFGYVEPKEVTIKKDGARSTFFHYIPILETLENVVKWYGPLLNFEKTVNRSSLLSSYRDGSVYKSNLFFSSGKNLEIIFYQDAVNLVNFIGSVRKEHKLLGVYMLVGNLPLHMHSQIKNINLVAFCKDKDFNADRVFGYIREDLSRLETEGIHVNGKDIYGSVVLAAGDNLGQHVLGCMVENFSVSLYFCRFCLITRKVWLQDCSANKVASYELRTVESYKQCLATLEGTNGEHCMGVKKDSEFNKLQHFHVCSPGLAPCIAHDLYLGIVMFDLPLHMNHLIKEDKWLTYDELNFRIKNFRHGDKNNLVEFPSKTLKLSGTAAEIRSLLKLLPLIIMDKVQGSSDVWQNILLLSHISDFVCAPCVDSSFLPLLQELINLYVEQRMKLFPGVPIRPKHHFLTHYPYLTKAFGPLVHVWTMNFERKHTVPKRITRAGRNFKNVTFSVSTKHQLCQASHFTSIPKGFVVMKGEVEFCLSSYSQTVQSAIRNVSADAIFDCGSVEYKGTNYVRGCIIVTGQTFYQWEVTFGRVQVLLCNGIDHLYLVVEEFVADFCCDLRAYTLSEPTGFKCLNAKDLLHFKPVKEFKVNEKTYLKLSHSMPYYTV